MNNHIQLPRNRFFTLQKANSSLVLVRPIVKELLEKHKQLVRVQKDIENIETKLASLTEIDEEMDRLADEQYAEMNDVLDYITHNIEELHAVGCVFKDFQVGIVDFPTHFEGRDVYLCWQYGENDITNWHEMEEGFKGRNTIDQHFLANSSDAATMLA